MFFALSLLLLASTASAQLDLSDRNDLRVDASVYIHAEVQNVFYRKAANTTAADRVVFGFAKAGLLLPIKDKLEDEKASEKNLAKPYLFSRASCVAVNLNQTGKVGLAKPAIVLDDIESTVFQYIDYSDFLIYSDFSRPFFEFEVTAFKQANVNSTSCTPVAADGAVVKQNFTERLCYTEDTFCNVWIGDNSDGWLYFGGGNTSTTANFGVQVFPRWNWSGSREEFTLNETNYLDVRPVDSLSDAAGTFTLSKTYSVPFEFNDCKVQDDGVLVFNIDENGNLVRYLSCNSLQLSENAYFVFDFNNKFDEAKMAQWKLPGVDKWNFTLPPTVRVKYASTTSVRVDPANYLEPWVELNRLPAPYELDGVNWLSTIEYRTGQFDLIRTWFTVKKRVTAAPGVPTTPGTTAAPTTTRPPAPTFVIRPCPNDCSGAGSCNTMTGQCTCDTGFIADAALGCKSNLETTGAGTTTTIATVAVETLLATTDVQVTQAPETQTQNVGLGTGTFTGTKAPTAGPRTTRPVATTAAPTTAGAAQLVLSFAALLLSLLVAF